MQFTYTAKDATGKEISGMIEAGSKLEAADKLFGEQKLTVISLEKTESDTTTESSNKLHIGQSTNQPKAATEVKSEIQSFNDLQNVFSAWLASITSIKPKEKVVFFRLLSVMINAGLPIVKSLKLLRENTDNPRLKLTLSKVVVKVENGVGFSKALMEFPDVFSESEIGVIAAGEASGSLNRTLKDLAIETEKGANLQGKIASAMVYPVIILFILVGVTVVVMTMVVPKLSELFLGAGVELPTSTRILIATSNWFIDTTLWIPNWLLFLGGIIGTMLSIGAWRQTEYGRYTWDGWMLHLPIFGTLYNKVALAAFSRQLSTLSSSGISIVRALEIVSGALPNAVYQKRIREIKSEVEEGVPIHQTIAADPLFPSLVVSMIAVGEQTAQLATVTQKIAEFYDEEVDTFVKNLSTAMEPLIIVLVGVLVGGLVAAIMQPIMMIADVASQG